MINGSLIRTPISPSTNDPIYERRKPKIFYCPSFTASLRLLACYATRVYSPTIRAISLVGETHRMSPRKYASRFLASFCELRIDESFHLNRRVAHWAVSQIYNCIAASGCKMYRDPKLKRHAISIDGRDKGSYSKQYSL